MSRTIRFKASPTIPGKDGALPYLAVSPLDEEAAHSTVLAVSIHPDADPGALIQGVPRMEAPAEGPAGGGAEGVREVEEPVEGPGPSDRWEMQRGGTGLSLHYGCG